MSSLEDKLQEIYDMAQRLEPDALVVRAETNRQDIKASWPDVERVQDLRKAHRFAEVEEICRKNLERYPRNQLFFNVMIDVIIKQNDLPKALREVQARRAWALDNPYKIITIPEERDVIKRNYQQLMHEWIAIMNGLNAQELDIINKIQKGYVYKPRKK